MDQIKIEIPAGLEIDTFDKSTGVIKFKAKPKNVMERIKTVADLLADNNIDQEQFDEQLEHFSDDEKAYWIIKLLVKTLNQGWVPDWSNSNELKYYPYFEMQGSSGFRFCVCDGWGSGSYVGSRLCYKSRALAEYAGKTFTSTYKQLMIID